MEEKIEYIIPLSDIEYQGVGSQMTILQDGSGVAVAGKYVVMRNGTVAMITRVFPYGVDNIYKIDIRPNVTASLGEVKKGESIAILPIPSFLEQAMTKYGRH